MRCVSPMEYQWIEYQSIGVCMCVITASHHWQVPQKFCITPLTGATGILHHTTDWYCRNSASHHWLALQKFCIAPLTSTAEILHRTTDWCCSNSVSHHWLVLQKFCITPLTGGAEILHPTTDWCWRNSAFHYTLVLPSNKSCSATTVDSFTVWFNWKDIQIVTNPYSNEGESLDYSHKEVVMAIIKLFFV